MGHNHKKMRIAFHPEYEPYDAEVALVKEIARDMEDNNHANSSYKVKICLHTLTSKVSVNCS